MQVEMRKVSEIKPYDKNPRDNDAAVEVVAHSIREYGFRQPIVVDAEGVIIVGHTRWKAAQKLGMETVPVHVVPPENVIRGKNEGGKPDGGKPDGGKPDGGKPNEGKPNGGKPGERGE